MCQTPSCCRIFSPNPSSSTALLDQSLVAVYTTYVCNPSEVVHVRYYVVVCRSYLRQCHTGMANQRGTTVATMVSGGGIRHKHTRKYPGSGPSQWR
jgi:hypothetical protein